MAIKSKTGAGYSTSASDRRKLILNEFQFIAEFNFHNDNQGM